MPLWYLHLFSERKARTLRIEQLVRDLREDYLPGERFEKLDLADPNQRPQSDEFLRSIREGDINGLVVIDLSGMPAAGSGATSGPWAPNALESKLRDLEQVVPLPHRASSANQLGDPPPNQAALRGDPVRGVLAAVAAINMRQRTAGGTGAQAHRRCALVVSEPPRIVPWTAEPDALPGLLIESPNGVNRALLQELWDRARPSEQALPDLVRGRLRELPPTLWGRYSPQELLRTAVPPVILHGNDEEFNALSVAGTRTLQKLHDRLTDEVIKAAAPGVPPDAPEAATNRAELIRRNLSYVLRLCRRVATWSLEGNSYKCTVVVTAFDQTRSLPRVAWLGECAALTNPTSFTFTDRDIRNHLELAQSENLVLFVNALDLGVSLIGTHGHSADHCRAMSCRRLAGDFSGVTIHVRDGKHVEVYDGDDLRLWYDGFAWQREPFDVVWHYLREFFHANEELAKRARGVLSELLDVRASSILVFADLKQFAGLKSPPRPQFVAPREDNNPKLLSPIRPNILSRRVERGRTIKTNIRLDALVGLLRVDGAHVIDRRGYLRYLAHHIDAPDPPGQHPEEFSGTGRRAASKLSWWLRRDATATGTQLPGFVVKVSASGSVYVFVEGRQVTRVPGA